MSDCPPNKRQRTPGGMKATHERISLDSFDVVFSRQATLVRSGRATPTFHSETPKSPQKGRTSWRVQAWDLNVPDDDNFGLLGSSLEDDGFEDPELVMGDAFPTAHQMPEVKKKRKHWVSLICYHLAMYCSDWYIDAAAY